MEQTAKHATSAKESNALVRGLRILSVIADAARPLTLSEISEMVQLPSSTTHRALQSLIAAGYVYQTAPGRYNLAIHGLQPLPLDHPFNLLRRDTRDLLRSLQAAFGPSAVLFIFLGKQRMAAEYVQGNYSVAPYFDTQVSAPLHVSVSGKILLSSLSEQERDDLLGSAPYTTRTSNSIVKRDVLFAELDTVAREGVATNIDENIRGIRAIGGRLATPSGKSLGAIVLTGPASFFNDDALTRMRAAIVEGIQVLQSTSAAVRATARLLDIF